jgi:plastocyanin
VRRAPALAALAALAAGAVPAGAQAHPGHGAVNVGISLYSFSPPRIDIVVNDVVFWTWNGPDTDHSVTGSGPGKTFDSDPGTPPDRFSHRAGDTFGEQFTRPGTYTYLCRKHDSMRGTIVVSPDTSGGAPVIDRIAPQMVGVALVPARMCRRCARPGGRLRFTLSELADVEGTVSRVRRGRRSVVRHIALEGRAGRNDIRFSVARLAPGGYEVALRAYDSADNASPLVRRGFTVR